MILGYIKFTDKHSRYFWHPITIETEDKVANRTDFKMEAMVGEES